MYTRLSINIFLKHKSLINVKITVLVFSLCNKYFAWFFFFFLTVIFFSSLKCNPPFFQVFPFLRLPVFSLPGICSLVFCVTHTLLAFTHSISVFLLTSDFRFSKLCPSVHSSLSPFSFLLRLSRSLLLWLQFSPEVLLFIVKVDCRSF